MTRAAPQGGGPGLDVVRALAAGLAVAAVLAACSSGPPTGPQVGSPPSAKDQVATRQVTVKGQVRTYRLFVPASVDRAASLIVVLHDAGGTAQTIAQATQFERKAATGGFVVAYPESLSGTWNGGFCCGSAPSQGIDDVGFLERLLEELSADPRIDPARIYVAGVSNGAVMAYRFACERAERIAGVASVAGALTLEACRPAEAVSVLEIHGTADPVVPYHGGELLPFTHATRPVPSTQQQVERWAALNSCTGEPASRREGPVTSITWGGCRDGVVVRLVSIEGGGHTWYASEFGPIDGAVDATSTIAEFFDLAS
ncbi:MAG: hypothetical protein M3N32_05530 [Actinomycetota bacterium]|nr:hypothetical protein [Actinomycetota bacterium]